MTKVSLSQYNLFNTIDLKSAHHQIPIIIEDENPYTAFGCQLMVWQHFKIMMNKIISDEGLKSVFAYLVDVTIAGKGKRKHDENF